MNPANDNNEGFCNPFIVEEGNTAQFLLSQISGNTNTCTQLKKAVEGLIDIAKSDHERLARIEELLGL